MKVVEILTGESLSLFSCVFFTKGPPFIHSYALHSST